MLGPWKDPSECLLLLASLNRVAETSGNLFFVSEVPRLSIFFFF